MQIGTKVLPGQALAVYGIAMCSDPVLIRATQVD